jgi:hypothetical protein
MKLGLCLITAAIVGISPAARVLTQIEKPAAHSNMARMESSQIEAARELGRLANNSVILPGEREMYMDAGKTAWQYVERHYEPATGLVDATSGYQYTTVWDMASGLAVLYAGHELKLIETAEYDLRMRRMLRTIRTMDLFDNAAFNKVYSTRTGSMVDRNQHASKQGYGWSATDVGRLLVWLKIIAVHQPQYGADAASIVGRLAMKRIVKGGYLWGEDMGPAGKPSIYQEGQIGYEQYAARGFALWGFVPKEAMSLSKNGVPVTVMGRTLLADLRGRDRLTSDPFVLMGLEMGWDRNTERLAGELLAAQEERYRKTGQVTIVAEDAVSIAPYFFYYYCAYARNQEFVIEVQDSRAAIDSPRWVSAKAAFAWHVLLPSAYTALALRTVEPARSPDGWSSGVYEASGKSTGTLSINTAAVILTAALVHKTGEPLLNPSLTQ